MGGKIVWMPTLAAENQLRWDASSNWSHPAATQKMRPATGIPVLNDARVVRDEVKEVLDVIAKNDMVLAAATFMSARLGWCSRKPNGAAF